MQVQPYLFFNGNCEEAVEFYQTALDAKVDMLMRFKDSPEPEMCPPAAEGKDIADQVMHVAFHVGETLIMASDDPTGQTRGFGGFALSLSPADAAEAERLFNALADGGKITMPLGKTFWSPCFGMVSDRFGVHWMINVAA